MSNNDPRLQQSYQWCYRVARQSGSSFYRAFWLLDRPQREAMFALYAFARITDDLGDDPAEPIEVRRRRLADWSQTLSSRLASPPSDGCGASDNFLGRFDELWPALSHSVERYRIPIELLSDLIVGVASDLAEDAGRVRMADWASVDQYCYRVASTVGLACICIWQAYDSLPRHSAIDCGLAFQLTNILRDLREDAARDRIYLPLDQFDLFHCDQASWLNGSPRGDWLGMVDSAIQRARRLYDSGSQIIDHLPARGRTMFWLMCSSYRELLETVAAQRTHLWDPRRIRVRPTRRVGLLLRSVLVATNSESLRRER